MVLNKCHDFLENASPNLFKKYIKEALVVKEIKYDWNEKMKALQEKGYNEKEILNTKKEMAKLEDSEFLKNFPFHGLFTSKREVTQNMASEEADETKKYCLHREIRYAKATLLNLPQVLPLFKLRSTGKYLPIQQYADNLAQYLDDSRSMTTLTMNDLNHVLGKLQGSSMICQLLITEFEE